MYKRLWFLLLLLSVVSQQVQCKSEEPTAPSAKDVDQELQLVAPEDESHGSVPHLKGGGEEKTDVRLIEDADMMTTTTSDDKTQCPADLCVCTHQKYGEKTELTVDCSSKNLTEVPAGVDPAVNRLFLQNNQLEGVPKDISKFQNLEELNVNDNDVKGFAVGSVSELPNLRVLQIANNRLTEFPQELSAPNLATLEVLDLGKNHMKDVLTADLFKHMGRLSALTLPVSKPQLIADLCHRLGATLQKVCINDCNTDVEECTNYAGNSTHFITATSAADFVNETERKQEAVIPEYFTEKRIQVDDTRLGLTNNDAEQRPEIKAAVPIDVSDMNDNHTKTKPENITAIPIDVSVVSNNHTASKSENTDVVPIDISDITDKHTESKPEYTAAVPIDVSDLTDNHTQSKPENIAAIPIDVSDHTDNDTEPKPENEVPVPFEVSGNEPENEKHTIPTEMSTDTVANTDATLSVADGETIVDFSLRSAVNSVADMPDSVHLSGVNVLQASLQKETQAKPEDKSDTAKTEISSDNEAAKQQSEGGDAHVNVGAASVKQGGSIDNSVIALIVAGMVVVVAGVTIQKNWNEIKKKFSSRPTAAANTATEANGTSPEEVPLQDKTMA